MLTSFAHLLEPRDDSGITLHEGRHCVRVENELHKRLPQPRRGGSVKPGGVSPRKRSPQPLPSPERATANLGDPVFCRPFGACWGCGGDPVPGADAPGSILSPL